MLDNEKNWSKKADLGWAKMRRELEREMPAAGPRRRPIFWWFLTAGAIAFAVSATAVSLFLGKAPKPDPSRPRAVEQAFEKPSVSTQVLDNQPFTNRNKSESAPPSAPTSAQNLPNSTDTNAAFSTAKKGAVAAFDGSKKAARPEPFLAKKRATEPSFLATELPFLASSQTTFQAKNEAEKPVFLTEKSTEKASSSQPFSSSKSTAIEPFLALQKGSIQPVFSQSEPAKTAFSTAFFSETKSKKPLRFGLELGAQTLDFGQFAGFAVGFAAEKKISKKADLQVGLLWNHLRRGCEPSIGEGFSAKYEQKSYVDQTQDSAFLFAELDKSSQQTGTPNVPFVQYLTVSANVFNRLELPVSLRFRLADRLTIGAGANFSWLLKAKIDQKIDSSAFATSIANSNFDFSAAPSSALLSRTLPRFDALAVGSVGYDFSKNWRLGLSFEQGFLNQNAVAGQPKRNRFWRFSATRWF